MNPIVAIKSCWKYVGRRDVCRNSWLRDCVWPYKFFVGSHQPLKPFGSKLSNLTGEEDLQICPTPDDFKNIGPKIKCMAQWAAHEHASHLIVADDDTYWRPERAKYLLQRMDDMKADVAAFMRVEPIYPQGSFYILKPKAFLEIASSAIMEEKGPDDVLVGRALLQHNIIWHHTKDIHVGPHWQDQQPRPCNSIISTHKCRAGEMLEAHKAWMASYGIS